METKEPRGTLEDIEEARRATARIVTPWWVWLFTVLACGTIWAVTYGDDHSWIRMGVVAVIVLIGVIALNRYRRSRASIRSTHSRRQMIIHFAAIVIGIVSSEIASSSLEPGSITAYAVHFSIGAAMTLAMSIALYGAMRNN